MYEANFGFHRQPFQCADLARAFFVSDSIRSILPQLLHALRSDLGIAVLTGPAGVGKTSLLKHLQSLLAHEGRAVMCSAAGLESPAEVLQTLQSAAQLCAGEQSSDSAALLRGRWSVVEQMRKTTEFWGPILLFIDDAQLLSVPVLNELRAFTEEEWNGRALVRCLIAGPLNLEEELARPAHADFSRRIRCHAFLQPLTTRESIEFLGRHLEVVGGRLGEVFSAAALKLIAAACDGMPRCLSLLADESLVVAAEQSQKSADEDCVRTALSRLQHLAYAWNASPLKSDDSDNSLVVDPANALPQRLPAVTALPGKSPTSVFEFGSAGVIEIGAPQSSTLSKHTVDSFGIDRLQAEEAIPAASPLESRPTRIVEPVLPISQSFEVGHRYQPDALESTEAIEMDAYSTEVASDTDDFYESVIVTTVSDIAESFSNFGIDAESAATSNGNDALLSPFSGNALSQSETNRDRLHEFSLHISEEEGLTTSSPQPVSRVTFEGIDFCVNETPATAIDLSERAFSGLTGIQLSSRLPVFDRYTWIALGRDVPAGTYAISSAAEMQRATSNHWGFDDQETFAITAQHSLTFDRIPITRSSDEDIVTWLTNHSNVTEQGEFVVHSPFAASQSAERLVEARNTHLFQNVTPADSGTEGREADSFNTIDNSRFNTPLETFARPGWQDGQLIFKGIRDSQATETRSPESSSESSNDFEHIALNFEAARLARDEHVATARDNTHLESSTGKFFSLPGDITTLEWDLRAGTMNSAEVTPLVDSLAALKEEITSFQQSAHDSIRGSFDAADAGIHSNVPAEASKQKSESLISVARQRLDSSDRSVAELITSDDSLRSSHVDSGFVGSSAVIADAGPVPSTTMLPATSSLTNQMGIQRGTAGSFEPRFGQLFTRLRQVRKKTGEIQ